MILTNNYSLEVDTLSLKNKVIGQKIKKNESNYKSWNFNLCICFKILIICVFLAKKTLINLIISLKK
jgi:hypothetical protein